jgi:hypothetical protein
MSVMDDDLLQLAAAPTTKAAVEALSERLGSADAPALSAEAFDRGEIRAALNLALAGALAGAPPPADLAARLVPGVESTDLALALLGCVTSGLADALIASTVRGLHSPQRQGLVLFLAAMSLDGREPPDELLRRIRLTARAELSPQAAILLGLAALEVDDPHVCEVARSCVAAADSAAGRRIRRELVRKLETPIGDALPEEAPPELFGGFTIRRDTARTGRNDPCPCGSGKKYKRCCISVEATGGPSADTGRSWGDRARFHRSMNDRQFEALHPLEIARIRPGDMTTARLLFATRFLAEHQLFDAGSLARRRRDRHAVAGRPFADRGAGGPGAPRTVAGCPRPPRGRAALLHARPGDPPFTRDDRPRRTPRSRGRPGAGGGGQGYPPPPAERSGVGDLRPALGALRGGAARALRRGAERRRALRQRERELEKALADAEARREKPADAPPPEELERIRKKVEEFKTRIREGNAERRDLRRRLSRIGSRIDDVVKAAPDRDDDADDLEYEPEDGRGRQTPRVPVFSREFRDGLKSVADHVARDALSTAGALAATEPGAWSSVKNIRSRADLLSCRIGRHRILFRMAGSDEIEFCRLIHRRDLDGTLQRMG